MSLAASAAVGAADAASRPNAPAVVVIAVADYPEGTPWHNPVLEDATLQTADAVAEFFRDRFQAEVTLLATREQTSSDSLRSFLRTELPRLAKQRLTLLFVLGHGQRLAYDSRLYKQDLMLVTSDAAPEHPEARSILVGTELLPALSALPDGSVVLAFLDQCYSGAASAPTVDVLSGLHSVAGIKAFVMASSSPTEVSYLVRFTRALLAFWEAPGTGTACTDVQRAPEVIKKLMGTFSPAQDETQEPEIILPFRGRLCLESFALQNGLLLLYNKTGDLLSAEVASADPADTAPSIRLDPYDVTPVRLARGAYSVTIRKGGVAVYHAEIDLAARATAWAEVPPVQPVLAGSRSRGELRDLAAVSVRGADLAQIAGIDALDVNEIRRQAVEAFALAGDLQASRLQRDQIARDGGLDDRWNNASKLAFQPLPKVMTDAPQDPSERAALADRLRAMGDFANAAELYVLAAKAAPSTGWAADAYLALSAAGETGRAKAWREKEAPRKERVPCDAACKAVEEYAARNSTPAAQELVRARATDTLAKEWQVDRSAGGGGGLAHAALAPIKD